MATLFSSTNRNASITISNFGLTATWGGNQASVAADTSKNDGKRYFEIELRDPGAGGYTGINIGVAVDTDFTNHNLPMVNGQGTCPTWSIACGCAGNNPSYMYKNSTLIQNPTPAVGYHAGHNVVLGIGIDFVANLAQFYCDGNLWGTAVDISDRGGAPLFPAFMGQGGWEFPQIYGKFYESAIVYLPEGYASWDAYAYVEPQDSGFLMTLLNGVWTAMSGTSKSALAYFDGAKWVVKEAGTAGQALKIGDAGDLEWGEVAGSGGSGIVISPTEPENSEENALWIDESDGTTGLVVYQPSILPSYTIDPDAPSFGGGALYVKQGGLYFQDYLGNKTKLVEEKGVKEVSILRFNGDLTDEKGNVWTAYNGASIDSTTKVFGSGALRCNENSQYIGTLKGESFNFGTGDFTIKARVMFSGSFSNRTFFAGNSDFWLGIITNSAGKLMYFASSIGSSWDIICGDGGPLNGTGSHTLVLDTFYDIVFERRSGIFIAFVNGEVDLTVTSTASIINRPTENINIGRWGNGGLFGNIRVDDWVVLKGEALYSGAYTVSTSAYASTVLTEPEPIPTVTEILNAAIGEVSVGEPAVVPNVGKALLYLIPVYVLGTTSLIPIMTSNTAPSGTASASSIYNSSYNAWVAFNGTVTSDADCWHTNTTPPGNLVYESATDMCVGGYAITTRTTMSASSNHAPKTWTVEYYDVSTSTWIVVDIQTSKTLAASTRYEYSFTQEYTAKKFRLNVTESLTGQYIAVGEFALLPRILSYNLSAKLSDGSKRSV